jgi:hypothetical protein
MTSFRSLVGNVNALPEATQGILRIGAVKNLVLTSRLTLAEVECQPREITELSFQDSDE